MINLFCFRFSEFIVHLIIRTQMYLQNNNLLLYVKYLIFEIKIKN